VIQYATAQDYTAWTGTADVPTNLAVLLRAASGLVARYTSAARYHTDPTTHLPTDPDITDALRDATCAQAATWAALGIDPLKGAAGIEGQVASSSIGGANIQYAVYASTATKRADAATDLAAAAYDVLALAGLLSSRVRAW